MYVKLNSCSSNRDLTLLNDYFPCNICDWEHGIKDVTGKQIRRENICIIYLYEHFYKNNKFIVISSAVPDGITTVHSLQILDIK